MSYSNIGSEGSLWFSGISEYLKELKRLPHSVSWAPNMPWTAWTFLSLKTALEITGENLEDLLAYDDLFLDYFNAFLSLPVFPQRLTYNRLTGAFEESDINERSIHSSSTRGNNSDGLPYGPTDEERERLLEWARTDRLPLFLSTQLFREFKLCKLLLRPLDDRYSASRGSSQQIRGYSRQSESYVSSLSNSADNSAHDEIDDDDFGFGEGQYRYSALFPYQRPGSRAYSVPNRIYLGSETTYRGSTNTETQYSQEKAIIKSATHRKKKQKDGKPNSEAKEGKASVKFENPGDDVKKLQLKQKKYTSEAEEAFLRHARVLSAPVNYEDYMRHPLFGDFDFLFGEEEPDPNGQVYVQFEDERGSEEQTETDVKNLEGRTRMSLQQLKEQILGTSEGMEGFKEFLSNTAGYALLNFWLDCEYYKDAMENFEDESSNDIRNRLFRDIQDRYKMNLTIDAKNSISKAASNANLSHTVFIRTQYDVLRRLRAYWVPRYLIHVERELSLSPYANRLEIPEQSAKTFTPFFPSISLVSSMPVLPDDVLTFSKTKNWEHLSQGGRRLDSRISSAKFKIGQAPPPTSQRRVLAQLRFGLDRFQIALATDKLAGGPFQHFLTMQDNKLLLSMLLFWQSVTEYGAAEERSADRLLRMCHAWTIYNNHIAPNSYHYIGFSPSEQDEIHKQLLNATDFIEASVFNSAKQYAMSRLQQAWIRYLKEDLKGFLDAHVLARGLSPPPTADVIEITVLNDQLVISRPDPWVRSRKDSPSVSNILSRVPTTESQRARRLKDAFQDDVDSEKRAELRMLARLRRKDMERERRKAIRNAYRRVREAKKKKGSAEQKEDGEEELDGDTENKSPKPPPPFSEMVDNRSIMKAFKKHLQEADDKERFFMIQLFHDVEKYLSYGGNKSVAKKKDAQATLIYKTYADSHGKKKITFNEKLQSKFSERPKTPTLKEMQHYILPKIDEVFKPYIQDKAAENGMEPREFLNLSQAELSLRLDTNLAVPNWKKGRKGKTGRGHPTKEDKDEFNKGLKQAAAGNMTLQMLYFYKYLLKHGEDDGKDKDKDFFFYIESLKFKECSQPYADEELLRRKVQSILDCFLESAITPTLQIDISSACCEKTLKAAQKYLAGKEVVPSIFDEAMVQVYPDLLGYWAGFKKTFTPPEDPNKRPITKYQKLLKSRLEKIDGFQLPSQVFPLPAIPEGAIQAYSFSLADGVKWRKESVFMGSMELSNSEAGSIMGSPTGEHSDVTTAVSMRRPSIVGTRESTRSKKQKTNTRLQLPGIQPTTAGESIAASGL
ncbi:regulator of G-protein signaling 22-like isoform X27 [Mytilus edulis]|uniref:regulator of G-protein signaling 22-like isoform X27 n=1 Tax=Mytilus edulis TaxID=6550 RepID=UPI0039EFB243